jgi:cytoskeletal protein RodZ
MEDINVPVVIAVGAAALLLIIFFIYRNYRDKKKYLPPDATDPVQQEKTSATRNKDAI